MRSSTGPAIALMLIAGCTIVSPIQPPEHDRRFPLKVEDRETIPCVNKVDASSVECSSEVKVDLTAFYGDLGRALWETDLRRRKLVGAGTERVSLVSAYNALLWPLATFFVTKKVHHPEWSTLDTAAVGLASYGLINSGIPDRDKLYLSTASRMACAMVAFEPQLYLKSEIERTETPLIGDALRDRTYRLTQAVRAFERKRDELVMTLPAPKPPGSPPRILSSIDQVRADAIKLPRGGGGDGNGAQQLLASFQEETDRLLTDAEARLGEAQGIETQLRTSGRRLRQQRSLMDAALTQALNAGTPKLVSPQARALEIAQALAPYLPASAASAPRLASSATRQSGKVSTPGWTPTNQRLAGLDKDSRQRVQDFWSLQRRELIDARTRVVEWLTLHDERARVAKQDLASMGCNESTLDEFSKELLKRVGEAIAAQAPASGASR